MFTGSKSRCSHHVQNIFACKGFFFLNKRVGKQKHMARYRGHSDAMNFTEDQLNFRSIINAQIEIELLIDETKFSKAESFGYKQTTESGAL